MKKERFPVFIQVKDADGFILNILWPLATPKQQAKWLVEMETGHGGDSSARGDKPGANKRERRKARVRR